MTWRNRKPATPDVSAKLVEYRGEQEATGELRCALEGEPIVMRLWVVEPRVALEASALSEVTAKRPVMQLVQQDLVLRIGVGTETEGRTALSIGGDNGAPTRLLTRDIEAKERGRKSPDPAPSHCANCCHARRKSRGVRISRLHDGIGSRSLSGWSSQAPVPFYGYNRARTPRCHQASSTRFGASTRGGIKVTIRSFRSTTPERSP